MHVALMSVVLVYLDNYYQISLINELANLRQNAGYYSRTRSGARAFQMPPPNLHELNHHWRQ